MSGLALSIANEAASQGYNEGYDKGYDKGYNEGAHSMSIEIVTKMLSDHVPLKTIVRYSSLPENEVRDLAAQLGVAVLDEP